jgi:hypothetical protein
MFSRSLWSLPIAGAAIFFCLATPATATTIVHGTAGVDLGYLENPLGLNDEPSSSLRVGRLDLTASTRTEQTTWRWSYSGALTLFDEDVPLDYMRHAVGLEWINSSGSGKKSSSAGLRWTVRDQIEQGSLYDHKEIDGYLVHKIYPASNLMIRGIAGGRVRSYSELPEESLLETYVLLEMKKFSENRTTIGTSVRLGGKQFYDPIAPRVWGTQDQPFASQLVLSLDAAKGVSDRVGLKASVGQRISLSDFPYWVQDDLFDNPLLDRYARSGWTANGSVKVLTPGLIWVETGVYASTDDYGAILFDSGDGGATRLDHVLEGYVSVERTITSGKNKTVLRLTGSWRDQSSDLELYDWSGMSVVGGVSWKW